MQSSTRCPHKHVDLIEIQESSIIFAMCCDCQEEGIYVPEDLPAWVQPYYDALLALACCVLEGLA